MELYNLANAHVYIGFKAASHELSYSLAGRLQLSQSGWLTLSVPSSLIRGAFDALREEGLELPPYMYIPVMSPSEISSIGGAEKVTERGHSFHYTLSNVRTYDPGNEYAKAWYIQILSPELKRLRNSYGLEAYPKGSTFQLPIAIRKNKVNKANPITKTSEYLAEPDWGEYNYAAVTELSEFKETYELLL